eukprot:CAMPEP_0174861600 /NCGR_PEP_ID=MMETSP1114-20130205/51999_1 /TAXON_ID=312471 /ORGANISM="Neobodo designis, Strain CCAP 1951/1" /LENGTH=238 /DNA_ID=CAMNT_0016096619 /DNA_START=33 /DNA_END=745 /DNA_ORIENTATION=+
MTFVPNARLEALSALAADSGTSLRAELFSCRKAAAMHKKRERQAAPGTDAPATSEAPTTPLSNESAGQGLLEAGSMLEAFARSTSYSEDSALPMYIPGLVATMNAMYEADGFDFSGVLNEEHFAHFTDAFEFEAAVAEAATPGIDWARALEGGLRGGPCEGHDDEPERHARARAVRPHRGVGRAVQVEARLPVHPRGHRRRRRGGGAACPLLRVLPEDAAHGRAARRHRGAHDLHAAG